MSIVFEDVEIPQDSIPETDSVEYPCEVCGREAGPYVGRGRKPKYCTEHRKSRSASGPRVKGANDALARQATESLVQLNALISMGLTLLGYYSTAGQIVANEEGFRVQVHNALLTDPKLAASIARAGTTSGKVALIMAYGMLGVKVGPVLVLEHKEIKASREADKDGTGT